MVKISQIRHFWAQIELCLIFRKILQLDKFEEVDSKYDNSFLKFQSQNRHLRNFLSKFRSFCFFTKFFAIRQNWECWFQTWQAFFKLVAQKHPNKTFFVPNLGIFGGFFCKILQIAKIEDTDFKYGNRFSKFLTQN